MSQSVSAASTRYYFVDEAGDSTLFDRKGQVIIGQEGCSRFFMLGFVDIREPEILAQNMEALRTSLLADPYFKAVPSMQVEAKKTALLFHAKDDVPEVRREVLALLRRTDGIRFFAVIRDKHKVVEYVRQRNEREPDYRYNPNELYDYMVRRLFKEVLHKDDEYHVCFASRGAADRTAAFGDAIRAAQTRFENQWRIKANATVNIMAISSAKQPCLQVADYFLWTLQRLYERQEDRYVDLLWPDFRVVNDIDDTRQTQYGVYYTQRKPLNRAALAGRL